ncbi:MAG: VOC family protein [Gammaproteobacteria bacterium]|nr:VOC family protein [Gammaproteobacteria bacterium]
MANAPGAPIWYELQTTDIAAAADFYGSVLGWTVAPGPAQPPPGGRDYRMIGRNDGGNAGGVLQLSSEMRACGARPMWLMYLCVPDVDAICAAIKADGGAVHMPKVSLPVGDIALVADPMGTPFYVMRPTPPPGRPDATSDVYDRAGLQRVRWNELASPDLAKARNFYGRHFGFQFNESLPMGDLGDYCFIDHDGTRLGAIMQQPPGSPPAAWLFYFGVKSVMAARRAVEAGGGKLLYGPMQVPGGEWVFAATDPEGVVFGIAGEKGE